jgi:hypothetical protein
MTLCRSRREFERVRHRSEQVQCRVWSSARRLPCSQVFAPATWFAGRSKAQDHCLALESSRLDHRYT